MRHHISTEKRKHNFEAMFAVLRDPNHLKALLFSSLIIFSGFTVIPYITIFSVHNVGILQADIPYIYLIGGAATLITARLIGHWADLHGKIKVYRLVGTAALVPLLILTHFGAAPLWQWLICTTLFFVLVSGRMIPAMAIITSAAQPRLRGTFMSLHGTMQSLSMGLATTLAGFIITENANGMISHYNTVGYIAITGNLLAIWFVGRIVMHDQKAPAPK
jgi:predicted MFS family arabinose efflux permease